MKAIRKASAIRKSVLEIPNVNDFLLDVGISNVQSPISNVLHVRPVPHWTEKLGRKCSKMEFFSS